LTPEADFDARRSAVLRLYQEERYAEALRLAEEAVEKFPDHGSETCFWVACLTCRTGEPARGLATLQSGLDRGLCWHPQMLRDPDLDPIRSSDEFAEIAAHSERMIDALDKRPAPDPIILPPTRPTARPPLLIALHGATGSVAFADHWRAAADLGVLTAVPFSTRHRMPEHLWWGEPNGPGEIEYGRSAVLAVLARLGDDTYDPARVILSGYSQGARIAITLALQRLPVPACGLVGVAPGVEQTLETLEPLIAAIEPEDVRGWLVVGENDWVLDGAKRLREIMTGRGLSCHWLVVPELGHDFPRDFSETLPEAIRFVLPGRG